MTDEGASDGDDGGSETTATRGGRRGPDRDRSANATVDPDPDSDPDPDPDPTGRTRLGTARARLLARARAHDRVDRLPLGSADGRVLAGAEPAAGLDPGHRLRPSDVGRLKAAGVNRVAVAERPTVGVLPAGDRLVQADPGPDEAVETTGLVCAQLVDRWGGRPTYRNVVGADRDALRAALQRDLTRDVVVVTADATARDLVVDVVADLGETVVDGVALDPGASTAVGVVEGRPILVAPAAPVACLAVAVRLLRPALDALVGATPVELPAVRARLAEPVASPAGVRSIRPVRLAAAGDDGDDGPTWTATPVDDADGPVPPADAWVVVPEPVRTVEAGRTVDAERWE